MYVIYPYKESVKDGLDLKYSLRSIEKNLNNNIYQVIIIGDRPSWLKGAIYYKYSGVYKSKDANMISKIAHVMMDLNIKEPFIRMADDYILIDEVTLKPDEAYHKGEVTGVEPVILVKWWKNMLRTYHTLKRDNPELKVFNYDTHTPQVYGSDFLEVIKKYPYFDTDFCINTLYLNSITGRTPINIKRKASYLNSPIGNYEAHRKDILQDKQFICFSDMCVNKQLFEFLNELFPDKSKWER